MRVDHDHSDEGGDHDASGSTTPSDHGENNESGRRGKRIPALGAKWQVGLGGNCLPRVAKKTQICYPEQQTRGILKVQEGPCPNLQVHRSMADQERVD